MANKKKKITKSIEELTAALQEDYNSLSKIIESRRKLKQLTGLSDTLVQNCVIDMYLEKIRAILFPEENSMRDDITDTPFLNVALILLKENIKAKGWELLISKELQSALSSIHVRINDNFAKRQKLLNSGFGNAGVFNITPSTSHNTATTSLNIKKAATNKRATSSHSEVPVKKRKVAQKKTAVKRSEVPVKKRKVVQKKTAVKRSEVPVKKRKVVQKKTAVKPFQWRVQLRKKTPIKKNIKKK